jgi:hypothetical protein
MLLQSFIITAHLSSHFSGGGVSCLHNFKIQFLLSTPKASLHAFSQFALHLLVTHSTYKPALNLPAVKASPDCDATCLQAPSQLISGWQPFAHCSNNDLQSVPRWLSSQTLNFSAHTSSHVLGSGLIGGKGFGGIEIGGNFFVMTSGCGWHLSKHSLSHSSRVSCFASMH